MHTFVCVFFFTILDSSITCAMPRLQKSHSPTVSQVGTYLNATRVRRYQITFISFIAYLLLDGIPSIWTHRKNTRSSISSLSELRTLKLLNNKTLDEIKKYDIYIIVGRFFFACNNSGAKNWIFEITKERVMSYSILKKSTI